MSHDNCSMLMFCERLFQCPRCASTFGFSIEGIEEGQWWRGKDNKCSDSQEYT